jgi:beta-lactamase regulating signal transducer with metallopeptidase domain
MTPAVVLMSSDFLAQLTIAAARALALASAAGLALAAFRVKNISVRLFTWTAVLYAALAMPLLEWMLPPVLVPTPVFLQHGAVLPALAAVRNTQPLAATVSDNKIAPREETPIVLVPATSSQSSLWPTVRWSVVAVGIYFAISSLLLVRLWVGLVFGHRLIRASQIINEPRMSRRVAARALALGLVVIPRAVESEFISVPVTLGILRPAILLPSGWREWDDTKLNAVVAHEVSHVARRDTLTQRLSLLHCAIFWFNPLAWWLNSHLADLAEQASDEAALSCGADCKDYARTLLGFFEELQGAPGRVWWQGVSMASAGRAEQRVERILAWRGVVTMRLKKSIAVVVITLAVPVVYFTASAQPANSNPQPQSAPLAQEQVPPVPPAPPLAAHAPRKPAGLGSSYHNDSDDGQRFVIASGKNDSLTMSGTMGDGEHVEELRKTILGDFIWFQREGKSYIIHNQATVDRAKGFWAPQEELGKKQEALGARQEALGRQQEELGAKMEQIQVKVPDMTEELEKLKTQLKQLNSSATMEQVGEVQSAIGELQSKLGDLQSQAGDQQSKLGDEMGVLGEQQGRLGEQQGELGRQQGEAAEQATREMKQLLDEAIARGSAQPEP